MEYRKAKNLAERIRSTFIAHCNRVEIAGSIRRRRANVGDIEIVAEPKKIVTIDLLGYEHKTTDPLMVPINRLKNSGAEVIKGGARFTQFKLQEGIKLDLFMVRPPALWGVIMAIRTGPAEFSKWLVTKRQHGGALPSFLAVKNGAIWNGNNVVNVSDERDFFMAIGIDWIEPRERDEFNIKNVIWIGNHEPG